ncbi:MAG TPA: hypothetical protein VNR87_03580 [Flavisolibacter sp.]|nr:hypothetical protein [Flavisolibacter sp.]
MRQFIFPPMTIADFTLLDEIKQAQTLVERGVFVAERLYKNFSIFLYQVDSFYVEIYHNLRYNAMQGMRSFEDDEALEPYLEEIDISCLYQL